MNSCYIISNPFLNWFSCSWKTVTLINNAQHLHPSSHFWLITFLPDFIRKTEVARELPHFPPIRSIHLRLNLYSSSKDNPFPLCSGLHTLSLYHTLRPGIVPLTLVADFVAGMFVFIVPQPRQARSSFRPLYFEIPQPETFFSVIFLVTSPSIHSIPCSNISSERRFQTTLFKTRTIQMT